MARLPGPLPVPAPRGTLRRRRALLAAREIPYTIQPPDEVEIAPHIRGGYNFDGCTPEVVLTRLSVKNGRLVLPDGMSYRV